MGDLRGLSKVRVSKAFLLEKLEANLKEHKRMYLEAMDGWHTKVVEVLEDMLKKAKKDPLFQPHWVLPKPETHESEYERAIELVKASLDKEFELNQTEFDQYIRDDWSWKYGFMTTVSGYGATVSG